MNARNPGLAAPEVNTGLRGPDPIVDVTLRVVTPMIGGGYESGKIDPEFPVNGKSIRGHLRFWWRACNAHMYATAADMFEAEAKIWGAAALADKPNAPSYSLIQIQVRTLDGGSDVLVADGKRVRGGYPGYALFPFFMGDNLPETYGRIDTRFGLTLSPAAGLVLTLDQTRQVMFALGAWILFGGVGARTRRGCGALIAESDQRFLPATFYPHLRRFIQGNPATDQVADPRLNGGSLVLGDATTHRNAWSAAIDQVRTFRSKKGDSGKILYNQGRKADLGLPLGEEKPSGGPVRMASPIIAKPMAISSDESRPLILCLNAPHPDLDTSLYRDPLTGNSLRNQIILDTASAWGKGKVDL